MLEIKKLSKSIEGQVVLDDISLQLPKERIIGLVGPNGAGKTTLMQVFAGLLLPDQGEVLIDGINTREDIIRSVVYMNQDIYFDKKWTGVQILKHYQTNCARFNFQRCMGMVKELAIDLKKPLKSLSRGMMERLVLTLTLSQDAAYYFLDEPLTGIDVLTREAIIKSMLTFADEHATIVISSHYMDIFELLFDEVYFIQAGKIIDHVEIEQMRELDNMTLTDYYRKLYKGGVF